VTPTLLRSELQHTVPDPNCTDRSTRATRFLDYVPGSLRFDLLHLLRLWKANRDTATDVIRDLRARLAHVLSDKESDLDPARRPDLTTLLNALRAQERAAVELVGVARRAARI
jgi:hypothetical protein